MTEIGSQLDITELVIPAAEGFEAEIRLLLKTGGSIETKDEKGSTALLRAAIYGNAAMVKLLLENGADIEAKDKKGSTALLMAASYGNEAIVRLLLENGANIEAKDNKGSTAMRRAALRSHHTVERLLAHRSHVVFRFSSPSLCQQCEAFAIEFDITNHSNLPFGYILHDSYAEFPRLKDVADAGCMFCAFIRSCLLTKIKNRPLSPDFPRFDNIVVDIEIKEIIVISSGSNFRSNLISMYFWLSVQNNGRLLEHIRINCKTRPLNTNKDVLEMLDWENPPEDGFSDDEAGMVMKWLRECDDHRLCKLNGKLFSPTRLIYVGYHDSLHIEVCNDQAIKYAALSYSWGSPKTDFLTTRSNLARRLAGFPEAELPQTLRDTIHVARQLDIQYIWIDALCIVQDDPNDWATEAEQMGKIYQNAYLTIAAIASRSSSDGFLGQPSRHHLVLPFSVQRGQSIVRNDLFCAGFPVNTNARVAINDSFWKKRGWTFQEHLLSTKLLFFTGQGLYFECLNSQKFGGSHDEDMKKRIIPWIEKPSFKPKKGATNLEEKRNPYHEWYSLVEEYSTRDFSVSGDKLPAISGLAHKFSEAIDDVYLAGLWRNDLARSILWRPKHNWEMKKSPIYRAPSWSWASLDGTVKWEFSYFRYDKTFKIIKAEMTPSGVDMMGQVIGGQLTVMARLMPVENMRHAAAPSVFNWSWLVPDVSGKISSEDGTQALAVAFDGIDGRNIGLLLKPADKTQDGSVKYCRIGFFHNCPTLCFDGVEPSVIIIV